jgi:hypothetical protein
VTYQYRITGRSDTPHLTSHTGIHSDLLQPKSGPLADARQTSQRPGDDGVDDGPPCECHDGKGHMLWPWPHSWMPRTESTTRK